MNQTSPVISRTMSFVGWLIVGLLVVATAGAKVDPKKCAALGFTGEVPCAQCDRLQEFVKDSELVAECKLCCVKDESASKYISVELQLHPARLNSQPEIKSFIDKHTDTYSKVFTVTFHNNFNVGSRLKCKKRDGGHDFIRVDSWKQSSFIEFMADRVEEKKKKK